MLAAFLTTILFSISAVSGRRTAALLGGTEANFWRLCFAAAVLAMYAHTLGAGLECAALVTFFISGCIGFGIGDMALFQALPRVGSRLSVMLVLCLSSPAAALLEWLWLGTPLTRAEVLSASSILVGVAVALTPDKSSIQPRPGFIAGVIFGIIAALCQAYGAVLSRQGFAIAQAAGENIDGITAAYQRILGGVAVTILVVIWLNRETIKHRVSGQHASASRDKAEQWRKAWAWVLLNGLAGPALGVSCYQWALKTTKTGIVLPIVALTPIVIIPFSHYIEGERATLRSLIGGLIAVGGAVMLAVSK